jgi:hypothetical protein
VTEKAGGTAGDAGNLTISAGGTITTSESIVATGGDAGALSPSHPPGDPPGQPDLSYGPITGNGSNGSVKGGNAGDIGPAGVAGKGGKVELTAAPPPTPSPVPLSPPNIEADRILVSGGRASTDPSNFPGVVFPAGDGAQRGIGGKGGSGATGGKGGSVGAAVVGGNAGKFSFPHRVQSAVPWNTVPTGVTAGTRTAQAGRADRQQERALPAMGVPCTPQATVAMRALSSWRPRRVSN